VTDLMYALRSVRSSPGFATVVIVTLAIGIGANTAIVSLLHTVLLRELPVTNPQELVFIRTAGNQGLGGAPPYPYFERIREQGASFLGVAAFDADELRVEVEGSVEQVDKHLSLREAAMPFAFVPLGQPVNPISRLTLSVASEMRGSMMARAVADEIRSIHPNTLASDIIGVDAQIDGTLVSERLLSMLATGVAVLVLALAAMGLYGIVSYAAAARTTEFGLRLALGAPRSHVAANVIAEAMLPVAAGVAIGLPLALIIARAGQRLLFNVTPLDTASYLVGASALVLVSSLAAWLPARRACRLDPAETLRRG